MIVRVGVAVGDVTAMTLDDYLDQLAADVKTVLLADVTQGSTSIANTRYAGYAKGDQQAYVDVQFTVTVRHLQDRPYGA